MANRILLLVSLFMLMWAWRAEAQFTPQGFNYQCIVRDATGASINNSTVSLLFTIRTGAPNGPISYSEKHTGATNEFGLINLLIGQGTPLQGAFNNINWGGGAKFLTVSVETAPNVFDELGTTQLMSVPYALYAANASNGGDDWGGQAVETTPVLSGDGTAADPLTLAGQGAQNGQVLKWNGTTWVPQNDEKGQDGTVTEINTGVGLEGGPISTTGTISLANTPVQPGIYGGASQIPVITVDQQGRITDVFTVTPPPNTIGITGAAGINVAQNGVNFTLTNTGDTDASDDITTTSTANGDVTGPFADLQIKADAVGTPEIANGAVTAAKLNNMGASSGQVLKWTGTMWAPAADALGTVNLAGGTGINVTGTSPNFTITNTGDTDASDDLTTLSVANGDISGPFSNLQIKPNVVGTAELSDNAITSPKINPGAVGGDKIAQMSATNGQVLKWNGTTWAPAADNLGSVTITGGVGIDVIQAAANNYIIANNGDINPFDDITQTSIAGGDLSGTFNNLQINPLVVGNLELSNNAVSTAKIQDDAVNGDKIAQMSAAIGHVLKWNGTTWAPAPDAGGDNWGNQVVATGNALAGNGTAINPLNLAAQGAQNGQVLKWNGSAWLPANDNAGAGDNWGTQVVVVDSEFAGDGTLANPLELASQNASVGQVLKWNGASWAPQDDALGVGDDWGTQVVETTGPELEGNGTAATPLVLASQGASAGQVLKWNGSSWAPQDDALGVGDDWGTQVAQTDGTLSGDGANTPLGIAQQSATAGQVLKWTGSVWEPADDNIGTGPADNWGSQVVITSTEFIGDGTNANPLELAGQGATFGQVLKWKGTFWGPDDDLNTGDNWGVQTVETGNEFSGNGTIISPLTLSQQGAGVGQVLKWNGSSWVPQDDNADANNYAAGQGIAITGTAPNFTIENTGDLSPTNEIQTLSLTGANLSLSNGGGTVNLPAYNEYAAGNGIAITGTAPNFTIENTGDDDNDPVNEIQTLSLLGANLSLSNGGGSVVLPAGNEYAAGNGIAITGTAPNFTIENTGDDDNDPANEIQTLSLSGANLSLSNGGGSVNLPPYNVYTAGSGINITGTAPNFTIENGGDNDNDPANELQDLVLNGKILSISGTNSSVDLDTVLIDTGIGLWDANGTNIFNGNTGNVGVGTDSPVAPLHVKGDGEALRIEGMSATIGFDPGTGTTTAILSQSSDFFTMATLDSSSIILNTTGGGKSFIIDGGTGNVGVGGFNTADARVKIFQSGSTPGLMIENTSGFNWDFRVSPANGNLLLYNNLLGGALPAGTFATNGVYTPSDRRFKKDITNMSGVLNKLLLLNPVLYRYNPESEDAPLSLGFIAQDVQKQFPELVMENQGAGKDPSSFLSLNYAGFGVLAVKAIQEQQTQIETLQKENHQLLDRLNALEARLLNLEQNRTANDK